MILQVGNIKCPLDPIPLLDLDILSDISSQHTLVGLVRWGGFSSIIFPQWPEPSDTALIFKIEGRHIQQCHFQLRYLP